MPEEQKKAAITSSTSPRASFVATFSGIMSACFAYRPGGGKPIMKIARAGTAGQRPFDLWPNLPELVVVLLGGFTTNFIWCVLLNVKNRTGYQYFRQAPRRSSLPRGALLAAGDRRRSGEAVVEVAGHRPYAAESACRC